MRCLSYRKIKRRQNKIERRNCKKNLEIISLASKVVGNDSPVSYSSSEVIQASPEPIQQAEYPGQVDEVIRGEYFEVDPEIIEVAFQHSAVLTKKDLADSSIHTSLEDMNEEQEWTEWWESDIITSVGINNLRQKYF